MIDFADGYQYPWREETQKGNRHNVPPQMGQAAGETFSTYTKNRMKRLLSHEPENGTREIDIEAHHEDLMQMQETLKTAVEKLRDEDKRAYFEARDFDRNRYKLSDAQWNAWERDLEKLHEIVEHPYW